MKFETVIEMYNEYLDLDGTININGITFYRSDILKEMDPIAYHVGLYNFCDSLDMNTDELV